MTAFVFDDGGREAAGFRGDTNDCVVRAIAIATGEPYREIYDELYRRTLADRRIMAKYELRYGAQARRHASIRTGVNTKIWRAYLEELGWLWAPTMQIGSGCTVHLRADELPGGALIAKVSKHVVAVVDGVIHDTYDPSRDGTRCVYGYFTPPVLAARPCGDELLTAPQRLGLVAGLAVPAGSIHQRKEPTVATSNDTTTADPKAEMKGLFETLLAEAAAVAPKTAKVEKAAYVRVDVLLDETGKHKTLAYVNLPTTKSVRVEIPKKGGGGYDVVKVVSEKDVPKAMKAIQANHERIVASLAPAAA